MPARPNWCRRVCSPTESLKGNFAFNYVSYLLIVSPFSHPRVIRKPEKSEHKLLQPASPVSHEQPSYGRWTSHPLTPPIFASEIIQLFHSFHPRSSVFCLIRADNSPERKLTGVRQDSVYSISISWQNKRNWTVAKMFVMACSMTEV